MKKSIFITLAVAILLSASIAIAKPNAAFRTLTKLGTEWTFERTMNEPGKGPLVNMETWTVQEVEKFGKNAARVVFVVVELTPRERYHQVEYFVQGNEFFDVHWLDRLRPNPNATLEQAAKMIPLFDVKKASKKPQITRYVEDALAYVRYVKLGRFKASNGKTYRSVIHSERNRGDTFPTDKWWFDTKKGLVQMELHFPGSSGGGTVTWKRTR
jgi:hypothetical protein